MQFSLGVIQRACESRGFVSGRLWQPSEVCALTVQKLWRRNPFLPPSHQVRFNRLFSQFSTQSPSLFSFPPNPSILANIIQLHKFYKRSHTLTPTFKPLIYRSSASPLPTIPCHILKYWLKLEEETRSQFCWCSAGTQRDSSQREYAQIWMG